MTYHIDNTEQNDNGVEKMSKKARRILALLNDKRHRERLMESLNTSTLDSVGPVGGDQAMKVLEEMNELGEQQEQAIRDSAEKIKVC